MLTGNLITLATAFVMGTAFAALLTAFVADLITPIIGMIFGKPDFSADTFTINSSHFFYGSFISAAITFISIGLAVFFFIVKPYQIIEARRSRGGGAGRAERRGAPPPGVARRAAGARALRARRW